MKNLLCVTLLLFASLFIFISDASATEIVLDTEHHHPGYDLKEELTTAEPESLVYTGTFILNSSATIESAELIVSVKSVVPVSTDEFLDKVYLNEVYAGSLNDYIPAETPIPIQ